MPKDFSSIFDFKIPFTLEDYSNFLRVFEAGGVAKAGTFLINCAKKYDIANLKLILKLHESGNLEESVELLYDQLNNYDIDGYRGSREEQLILELLDSGDIDTATNLYFQKLRFQSFANHNISSKLFAQYLISGLDEYAEELITLLENIWPSDMLEFMRLLSSIERRDANEYRNTFKNLYDKRVLDDSLGKFLRGIGNHELAYQELIFQTSEQTDDLESLETLILYDLGSQKYSEVKKWATQILKSNKDNIFALCAQARVAIKNNNYELATDYLKRVESIDKNHKDFHNMSAIVLYYNNRYREAITCAMKAEKLEPLPDYRGNTYYAAETYPMKNENHNLMYEITDEIMRLQLIFLCQLKLKFYNFAFESWGILIAKHEERYGEDLNQLVLSKDSINAAADFSNKPLATKSVEHYCRNSINSKLKGSYKLDNLSKEYSPNKIKILENLLVTYANKLSLDKKITIHSPSNNKSSTKSSNLTDWSSIKKIQLSFKNTFGSELKSHFVTLSTDSHDLPPVHLEPACFSLLWFLILHYKDPNNDDASWFNYFKKGEGQPVIRMWPVINKIWKAVRGIGYYSYIHEAVEPEHPINDMTHILEDPVIIKKIEKEDVGSWVIDTENSRRGNYIAKIKRSFKTEASIINIPKNLFISDRPIPKNKIIWRGLYKLNDEYFRSIQQETPDL